MTVVVDLLAGASQSNSGDPIDIESVNLVFLETEYGIGSITPEIEGASEPDTLVANSLGTGAVAYITGNWPSPLSGASIADPFAIIDWVDAASSRRVQTVDLVMPEYRIIIDFNGEGPTLQEFVESFTEDTLLAFAPEINGSVIGGDGPGTAGDDTLIGTAQADDIRGLGGDDRIEGRGRGDDLQGDSGNDTLLGQGGNDTLRGGSGRDRLEGGRGNDSLYGEGARDVLLGGAGRDRLEGGSGNDVLRGGAGRDTFLEQDGNDRYIGGGGADRFIFTDEDSYGNDRIIGYDPTVDQIIIRTDLPRRFGDPGDRYSGAELADYIDFIQEFGTVINFTGTGITLDAPVNENSSIDIRFTQSFTQAEFWESVTLVIV